MVYDNAKAEGSNSAMWKDISEHVEGAKAPFTLWNLLDEQGADVAFLALEHFDYKDYCSLMADVAESVLSIFEDDCPNDMRPRDAIRGIHLSARGEDVALGALQIAASRSAMESKGVCSAAAACAAVACQSFTAAALAVAAAGGEKQWEINGELMFDFLIREKVRERVLVGVGEASMCWSNIEDAGVFQAKNAERIGYAIVDDVSKSIGGELRSLKECFKQR